MAAGVVHRAGFAAAAAGGGLPFLFIRDQLDDYQRNYRGEDGQNDNRSDILPYPFKHNNYRSFAFSFQKRRQTLTFAVSFDDSL